MLSVQVDRDGQKFVDKWPSLRVVVFRERQAQPEAPVVGAEYVAEMDNCTKTVYLYLYAPDGKQTLHYHYVKSPAQCMRTPVRHKFCHGCFKQYITASQASWHQTTINSHVCVVVKCSLCLATFADELALAMHKKRAKVSARSSGVLCLL